MSKPIRLLIADDHTLFRNGLCSLFAGDRRVEVVADVADGQAAVARTLELKPDVVLMDIQMPALSGIEATRRVTAALPNTGVIMLTMFEDDDSIFAAMRAGARGYVLKGADQEEMLRVIEAVAGGEAHFGADIAMRLRSFFSRPQPQTLPADFAELTAREREVLDLVAAGANNGEIGRRLDISEKTVRNHVSNILNKLQVADRVAAIIKAREAGMGS